MLIDSGGSPENCPKMEEKHNKINDFGGCPEHDQNIVLGRLIIVKIVKTSFFGQLVYYILTKTLSRPPAAAQREAVNI